MLNLVVMYDGREGPFQTSDFSISISQLVSFISKIVISKSLVNYANDYLASTVFNTT